jgi:hypothetical protein
LSSLNVHEPLTRKLYPLTPRDLEVIAELTDTRQTETRAKATNRISKMLEKKDVAAHIREGERWDAMRNRFVADSDRPRGINATRRAQGMDQHGERKHSAGGGAVVVSKRDAPKRGRPERHRT